MSIAATNEMWYVLEGNFRFITDWEVLKAHKGLIHFVREERPNASRISMSGDSRIPVMFAPSGMERFFEEHALLPPGEVDPIQYEEIAEPILDGGCRPTVCEVSSHRSLRSRLNRCLKAQTEFAEQTPKESEEFPPSSSALTGRCHSLERTSQIGRDRD